MNELKRYIDNFSKTKILVIGDLMVDEYIFGNVDRISPEAPVPVLDVKNESFTLGGAGNVVKNLISLGSKVSICSAIGFDNTGENLLKMLRELKVDTRGLVIDQERKTSKKTRIIAGSQQVVRVDRETREPINGRIKEELINFLEKNIEKYDAIIISDYAKGIISKDIISICVEKAKKKSIPINVDPKEKNFPIYEGVTTITPNLKELSEGTGIQIEKEEDILKAAIITLDSIKCKIVLATRGADGMSIFKNDCEPFHIPTFAKKVFDVTGAGDTVISVYTLALVSGANEIEASYIANAAAGYVVGQIGAVSISYENLIKEISELSISGLTKSIYGEYEIIK